MEKRTSRYMLKSQENICLCCDPIFILFCPRWKSNILTKTDSCPCPKWPSLLSPIPPPGHPRPSLSVSALGGRPPGTARRRRGRIVARLLGILAKVEAEGRGLLRAPVEHRGRRPRRGRYHPSTPSFTKHQTRGSFSKNSQ